MLSSVEEVTSKVRVFKQENATDQVHGKKKTDTQQSGKVIFFIFCCYMIFFYPFLYACSRSAQLKQSEAYYVKGVSLSHSVPSTLMTQKVIYESSPNFAYKSNSTCLRGF